MRHGTFETIDGRAAVRFERNLRHPVEAVWAAVTEPDELAHWFPSAVAFDALASGAGITFTFPPDAGGEVLRGEVLRAEAPRRLVFTWAGATIDIALDPIADGTRLTFVHLLEAADEAARTAAGWDVCLEQLERALGGEDVAAPGGTPTPEWRERYAAYEARGFPAGAPVPGGA
jgi:uncharacterized protein YndB with AHSA1/START domain